MGVSRLVRALAGLGAGGRADRRAVRHRRRADRQHHGPRRGGELPAYREKLTAWPGVWTPAAVAYAYQWLRDGVPLAGATTASYRPASRTSATRSP